MKTVSGGLLKRAHIWVFSTINNLPHSGVHFISRPIGFPAMLEGYGLLVLAPTFTHPSTLPPPSCIMSISPETQLPPFLPPPPAPSPTHPLHGCPWSHLDKTFRPGSSHSAKTSITFNLSISLHLFSCLTSKQPRTTATSYIISR